MAKKSFSKSIVKDIVIVGIGVLLVWVGLQIAFGTQNPFYVVASGSMIPVLEVYDVLIVQGNIPFEDIQLGDIIVFDRPSDHNRVIVHRVITILSDEPKTIKTKGDANPASIPGTDFPITEDEYIGKVVYVLPQVGYVTQILKPPVNYIIIAIVIGIMIFKQMSKQKKESANKVNELESNESSTHDDSEIADIVQDSEYTDLENHGEKSEIEKESEEKNPNSESDKDEKREIS
ncbi:MAG: signal peptidase I [Nitrosopumilus sp.]